MSDPDEAAEVTDRVFGSIVNDPETQAWTFAAMGPDGSVLTYGESGGDEKEFEAICAAVLVQFASASNGEEKEFIRNVIQEYNDRKTSAHAEHGEYGGDSE